MKFALFLGCMIPLRLPQIEAATRIALSRLGVELEEMQGAGCCPDPISFQSISEKTWLAYAARNLTIAEEKNLDILTLCNGCYETLKTVNVRLKQNDELRSEVNQILAEIDREFKGKIKVKNILEVLSEIGWKNIRKKIETPVELKVATHEGCHLNRPSDLINFDDPFNPTMLEEAVEAIGAHVTPYLWKTLCCGAGLSLVDRESSLNLVETKLEHVAKSGAQCLVVVCPYCMIQYDIGQFMVNKKRGRNYQIPVLYYTQLLCLALGIPPEKLGFNLHRIPPNKLFERLVEIR